MDGMTKFSAAPHSPAPFDCAPRLQRCRSSLTNPVMASASPAQVGRFEAHTSDKERRQSQKENHIIPHDRSPGVP
jgi:hypothetical protein